MQAILLCSLILGIFPVQPPAEKPLVEAPKVPAESSLQKIPEVPASELRIQGQGVPPWAYPVLAELGHVQGRVRLIVRLGADGAIQGLEAVSGPPMLRTAAERILRPCRFAPVKIDGKASPVVSAIDFPFVLEAGKAGRPKAPVTGFSLKVQVQDAIGGAQAVADFLDKGMRAAMEKAGLELSCPMADKSLMAQLESDVQGNHATG